MFKRLHEQWALIAPQKKGHNCCSGTRSSPLARVFWLGAVSFVLIGAFERFRRAVYHGPGLCSQAPKYSALRHPASSVKGKLFPCSSSLSSWTELSSCAVNNSVNEKPNKTKWEMSFGCLVPMSCHAFMLRAKLLSFITRLGRVCVLLYVRAGINVCLWDRCD